ncbi:MAG: sigma-54-dependent Fis family transcriptional regulator [Negativicutes bacterium]
MTDHILRQTSQKTIRDPHAIKTQWENFIYGKPVDASVLSDPIWRSWQRSRSYGVDPFTELEADLAEAGQRLELAQELLTATWPYLEMIGQIIGDSGLRFDLFDREGYSLKILGDDEVIATAKASGFTVGSNRSEQVAGTGAVALALIEDKPFQILGPEHYNILHHAMNCSATPIHDPEGRIIGVLNISSYTAQQTRETLGLVTSIAKAAETRFALNKTIDHLKVSNDTLSKIMEYLPHGIAYIGETGNLERYNQRILELFELEREKFSRETKDKLETYLRATDCWQQDGELRHRETVMKLPNRKKSFLISSRKIQNRKGTLVIIEDTDSILRLNTSLRGNRAIYQFEDIVGEDPVLKQAKTLARKVAGSSSAVLLQGESGTGKELFAQSIHNASPRRDKPFVAINCGAIPSELIESELFGYEPGAFTGAGKGGKPGKFEIASGGTLFLDEVESMPLNVQIKLLRALSTDKIVRIGGISEIPTNIRLISATKKDLLKEADEGNFREDLYYRINIITIQLPPLRDRGDDIRLLAQYYLQDFAQKFCLSKIKANEEFFDALAHCAWRGNIRELKNVIERTLLLVEDAETLGLNNLPDKIVSAYKFKQMKNQVSNELSEVGNKPDNLLKVAEEIAIRIALTQENGNLFRTALRLGIARSTLYEKIRANSKLQETMATLK